MSLISRERERYMSPTNTENDLHREMKRLQDTVLWHDHPKGKLSNCRNDKCNGNLQHMTRAINCTFQLFSQHARSMAAAVQGLLFV